MRKSVLAALAVIAILAGPELAAQHAAGRMPAMREVVYEMLTEAQSCAEHSDIGCAQAVLDQVRERDDLNSYERAQLWNFQAFVDFEKDNIPAAIEAYELMLAEEDVPLAMQQTTKWSLAQLYIQQERWNEGLATLDDWQRTTGESPPPEQLVLRSQVHYQRGDYAEGLAAIEEALQLAAANGTEPKESWYQLMYVHLWNLEDYEGAADVLEEMIRLWPEQDHYMLLSAVHGKLGNHVRQLDLLEGAYAAGWLRTQEELVTLAGLMIRADRAGDGLSVLERGIEDGGIAGGPAVVELVDYASAIAAALVEGDRRGSRVDPEHLDELLDAATNDVESVRPLTRRGDPDRETIAN